MNNQWGHIIRWRDGERHTGTTFTWDIFVLAKDVADAGDQMFGSPDGLWADPDGRVFIETDGAQPGGNNDQLLVADSATGEIRRLFTGVKSCEVTGITVTPGSAHDVRQPAAPGRRQPGELQLPRRWARHPGRPGRPDPA